MQAEEGVICPGGCGQPLDESVLPAAEGRYRTRLITCHACADRQKTEADLREQQADAGIHLLTELI